MLPYANDLCYSFDILEQAVSAGLSKAQPLWSIHFISHAAHHVRTDGLYSLEIALSARGRIDGACMDIDIYIYKYIYIYIYKYINIYIDR